MRVLRFWSFWNIFERFHFPKHEFWTKYEWIYFVHGRQFDFDQIRLLVADILQRESVLDVLEAMQDNLPSQNLQDDRGENSESNVENPVSKFVLTRQKSLFYFV